MGRGKEINEEKKNYGTDVNVTLYGQRSEEHTSELQSRPHISYAVFCLKKKKTIKVLLMPQTEKN